MPCSATFSNNGNACNGATLGLGTCSTVCGAGLHNLCVQRLQGSDDEPAWLCSVKLDGQPVYASKRRTAAPLHAFPLFENVAEQGMMYLARMPQCVEIRRDTQFGYDAGPRLTGQHQHHQLVCEGSIGTVRMSSTNRLRREWLELCNSASSLGKAPGRDEDGPPVHADGADGVAAKAAAAAAAGSHEAPSSARLGLTPAHTDMAMEYEKNMDALKKDKREIVLFPTAIDLSRWTAYIRGPDDSPFARARFKLAIHVPTSYPHNPPKVVFETLICHPNIHMRTGEICLDVLKDAWTPIWTLESVCRAVVVLLGCPNPLSPLNCDASNLLRWGDMRGFWSLATTFVAENALLCDDWHLARPPPADEKAKLVS